MKKAILTAGLVLFLSGMAGAETGIPYSFPGGAQIKPYELNANFQVLLDEVNKLAGQIRELKASGGQQGAGAKGPKGDPGPQGAQGQPGPPGAPGIAPKDVEALKKKLEGLSAKSLDTLPEKVKVLESIVREQKDLIERQTYTIGELRGRINELNKITRPVSISEDGKDLYITGVNLNILNGTGTTFDEVNGVGNLIIGYNEPRGWEKAVNLRTGSHNLVVGRGNNFSSYGGIIAGYGNTASAPYATVSGGSRNSADGPYSSVSGGNNNTASGPAASVTGGNNNTASAEFSSINGGENNTAKGPYSTISGGDKKTSEWKYSHIPE